MNLGEFKSLLGRYLKRNDLSDLYNDWVNFTQLRIDSQLRLSEQEYRTIMTPTSKFVALPDDFIEMRHLQTSQEGGRPVQYVTPAQLDAFRAIYGDSFSPISHFTIVNNQIELSPAPGADSVAELEMYYYAKLPTITQDAETTKVLTAYPNLYLYGCMNEAAAFREAEGDLTNYATMWRDYAKELNDKQAAARYSGDSVNMRPG